MNAINSRSSMTFRPAAINPLAPDQIDDLVDMAIRIWAPVFPSMQADIPDYVYGAFYPEGWEARQRADVGSMCQDGVTEVHVAFVEGAMAGFVGLQAHPEDRMGVVHILGVDPAFQRHGVGRGLSMAMVETGGDRGHAPSRATYEAAGFERHPVAQYFRKL